VGLREVGLESGGGLQLDDRLAPARLFGQQDAELQARLDERRVERRGLAQQRLDAREIHVGGARRALPEVHRVVVVPRRARGLQLDEAREALRDLGALVG